MLVACCVIVNAGAEAETSATPATISLAMQQTDIDVEQCRAFAGGRDLGPASSATLAALLGLAEPSKVAEWTTGPQGQEVRHFRLAFRRPIALGTLCSNAPTVSILRSDAEYPGDVTREELWQSLDGGPVFPLSAATPVRAVRLTYKVHNLPWETIERSTICDPVRLLAGRYWSPESLGGQARNKLKPATDKKGPKDPGEQWIGYWPVERVVAGVVLFAPAPDKPAYWSLRPESSTHPRLAEPSEWQPLTTATSSDTGIVTFANASPSLAIRATGKLPTASKPWLASLVSLSDGEQPPRSFQPPAAYNVRYQLPLAGFVAARVSDAEGRHVRRLIAEVPRNQGEVLEPWDLTDDAGRTVQPGNYSITGVVRPPLKLTHEMTVYNSGSPPWNAPVRGGGGWMADHSPPVACCAVGDRMFFSAMGAEFGYALIATDLSGAKVWSDHQGAHRLVSDGRAAYAVNNDEVVRIDPHQDFAKQVIHKFQYDDRTPGHTDTGYIIADYSGAAARDGLLCVSYRSTPAAWVRSAIRGDEIDLKQITPPIYPRKVHDTALNPLEEVYSTFQATTSSTQAHFGNAPTKGPLANTLVLPFKTEVPLGSIVVSDASVEVWALKNGKTLPKAFQPTEATLDVPALAKKKKTDGFDDILGDMQTRFDPETWIRLKTTAKTGAGLAIVPENIATRAVVFTSPTLTRLDYGMLLDRRYDNVAAKGRLVVGEGKAGADGSWKFERDASRPISLADPASASLVWDQPQGLRGCVLTRPLEWSGLAIDVWTGPVDRSIDAQALADDAQWREVHRHRQTRNHVKFNWHTNRLVVADFGELVSTRALRVRFIEAPQGAGAPTRSFISGGFESLIALAPATGNSVTAADLAERVTVLTLPRTPGEQAKLLGHLPLTGAGALAFDRVGTLYAACSQGIVRLRDIDRLPALPRLEVVVPTDRAGNPRALAFRADGKLCAIDRKTKQVRVFDVTTGLQVEEFGGAPPSLGTWDPGKLIEPVALAFDAANKLWIVEQQFQPKRISRWTDKGRFEQEFLGPTHYGGGGMMDPGDRTVVNHLGMKFRIDYGARTWKLESRLAPYGGGNYLPDRVAYVERNRYLIGDRPVVTPFGDPGPTSVVCREMQGVAVPIVAAGVIGDWAELARNVEVQKKVRDVDGTKTGFIWVDHNSDALVQADEVQLLVGPKVTRAPYIGDDLSLNFSTGSQGFRIRASSIRSDGTPLYDGLAREELAELSGAAMVTGRGDTFILGHKMLGPDGKLLWTYPDNYMSVQRSYQTPWGFYDRPPGVLAGGFGTIGHFDIAGETLFCVGGNNGDYYAFTRDGLLAATIVGGPTGYGKRFFSIPDYVPGRTDLSDLRKTVEDFHGHVTRAEDGNVYAIAGKNHVTVMRVDGLEKLQRFSSSCVVTGDDLVQVSKCVQAKARVERFLSSEGPKICTVPMLAKPPVIDGDVLSDWPGVEMTTIREVRSPEGKEVGHWKAKLGFDAENLYVAVSSVDHSPLANRGADRKTLFQSGDTFDLHLGLDPEADPARTEAAQGDIRLVMTALGDEAVCMLYRYRANKPVGEPTVFRSPVGEITIDEVRAMSEAKTAFSRLAQNWTFEAAIPWRALGRPAPVKGLSLRGDLGVTESDSQGITTIARHYWANHSQVSLSDLPSEARVLPALWGEFRFEPAAGVDSLLDK